MGKPFVHKVDVGNPTLLGGCNISTSSKPAIEDQARIAAHTNRELHLDGICVCSLVLRQRSTSNFSLVLINLKCGGNNYLPLSPAYSGVSGMF